MKAIFKICKISDKEVNVVGLEHSDNQYSASDANSYSFENSITLLFFFTLVSI